jgi:hypothetical protein
MIDPLITLAFSVHSNKGVYALLLASGISTAAGIPTGWEIVLDLIRKLAALEGADCEPDLYEWFTTKHGTKPDYSELLDALAKTPTERQRLLRGYFEPTEEERAEGLKVPTPAHKAIAQLAADGFIRVIVTTNFDRLQEQALEALGVSPTVISTADAVAGTVPLTHSGVTVIKVNGDYFDTRIKNTLDELSSYDDEMNRLLDRVFDEYGLIVCGWSAEWDGALRTAIERCPNRRYTTFWATRSDPSDAASRLIRHRGAQLIRIAGANEFFITLLEKVQALADFARPHPLSSKMAIATTKRYLGDAGATIKLADFVRQETERVHSTLNDTEFPTEKAPQPSAELMLQLTKYEALSDVLLSIFVVGCYWGGPEHSALWVKSLTRIAHPATKQTGLLFLVKLQMYPALLLFYAGGIAAIAGERYSTLVDLLTKTTIRTTDPNESENGFGIYPGWVFDRKDGLPFPGRDRDYTPLSNHLRQVLREPLKEHLAEESDYDAAFDRLEYLFSLRFWQSTFQNREYAWAPLGGFAVRSKYRPHLQIMRKMDDEIKSLGGDWPPLKAGVLDGSIDEIKQAKQAFDRYIESKEWGY